MSHAVAADGGSVVQRRGVKGCDEYCPGTVGTLDRGRQAQERPVPRESGLPESKQSQVLGCRRAFWRRQTELNAGRLGRCSGLTGKSGRGPGTDRVKEDLLGKVAEGPSLCPGLAATGIPLGSPVPQAHKGPSAFWLRLQSGGQWLVGAAPPHFLLGLRQVEKLTLASRMISRPLAPCLPSPAPGLPLGVL